MAQKGPLHWRREDVIKLIDLYKANVCLWQVNHHNYRDRNARDGAMRRIQTSLKKQMTGVTGPDIKNKLHTLRSQYRRELRAMKESTRSNDGGHVYRPRLWCFDAFHFLNDAEEIRDPISVLDFEEEEVRNCYMAQVRREGQHL